MRNRDTADDRLAKAEREGIDGMLKALKRGSGQEFNILML
jgi:hypothetical protein